MMTLLPQGFVRASRRRASDVIFRLSEVVSVTEGFDPGILRVNLKTKVYDDIYGEVADFAKLLNPPVSPPPPPPPPNDSPTFSTLP